MIDIPEMTGDRQEDRGSVSTFELRSQDCGRPAPAGVRKIERGASSLERHRWRCGAAGVSLIELVVTVAILGILTAAILPLARVSIQREKEIELRRALRDLRTAIDDFKKAADAGRVEIKFDSQGYPPNLKVLVDGVEEVGKINHKLKFLRHVPMDPMTNSTDWGLRSYQDEPNATSWGEQNVYDVHTKSMAKALDGTTYNTW